MKRILIFVICVLLAFSCLSFQASAQQDNYLRFNSDGKFKIMMINDPQETDISNPRTLELIRKALDSETPDGIKIGYNAGAGFRNAGNGDQRSVRLFVIDQNDPWNYETYVRTYRDLTGKIIPFYITDIVHSRWEFVIKQYWHAFVNLFTF